MCCCRLGFPLVLIGLRVDNSRFAVFPVFWLHWVVWVFLELGVLWVLRVYALLHDVGFDWIG